MTLTVSTPITGVPQTGMTAPSFTVTADNAVNVNSRRWVVTAASDAGSVAAHSNSLPFFVEMTRPAVFKSPPPINAVTNLVTGSVPKNEFVIHARKGCNITGAYRQNIDMHCTIKIPAGADVDTPAEIRALLSLFGGFINEDGDGIGDVLVNGILG